MSLIPCAAIAGEEHVFSALPKVRVIRDAIYVPIKLGGWMDSDLEWGIYDSAGFLIEEAAYRRGPGPVLVGQSQWRDFSTSLLPTAPAETYVYGGLALRHYGHFLLDTLCRHWTKNDVSLEAPWLYHKTDCPIDVWRNLPFVSASLDGAGFYNQTAISFDEPTRIPMLVIPGPAFEETYGAHEAFRGLASSIGRQISPRSSEPRGRLAYLSKEKLSHGIRRVINEEEVTRLLMKYGVAIYYPEQMSLSEQISCFNNYDVIISTLGSALHTVIFSEVAPRMLGIYYEETILSSFKIIDKLTRGRSLYLRPSRDFTEFTEVEGFYSNIRWDKPNVMADLIMSVVEIF